MAVVNKRFNDFLHRLHELIPEQWWWGLYGDRLRIAWENEHCATPAAPSVEAAASEGGFADWLAHEMPPGTVISNPRWWAPRIERAIRRLSGQGDVP